MDVLQKLLDPAEGDAAVARALYSADLLEQKTKILPYPPIKDPAVTRERKAKYADGTCLYVSTVLWPVGMVLHASEGQCSGD